ncbi:MAG: DUF2188 domain-containing protein [Solirubrobacterales bacterium]
MSWPHGEYDGGSSSPRPQSARVREDACAMARNEHHVVRNSHGGWDVVKPGARRASGSFSTQNEAINQAREIVRRSTGGEVIVHRPDGTIRESDTIPPADGDARARH